ncbi:MAG: hypothetical protein LBJ67_04305 [Planctomycetaceae bacterium]|jgi:hypothetical protein|nr:hypothetical protein [Planctomycetaceae bacterium]
MKNTPNIFIKKTLLFFILLLTGNSYIFTETYSVSELAKLNQKYWENFNKIDLVYTERHIMQIFDPDAQKTNAIDETRQCRWFSDGKRDLLEDLPLDKQPVMTPEGNTPCYICQKFDGTYFLEECVSLEKGKQNPQSLVDSLKLECRASLLPYDHLNPKALFPKATFLQAVFRSEDMNSPLKDMSQLIKTGDDVSEPIRSLNDKNDVIWTFRITYQNKNNKAAEHDAHFEVSLNESKGFVLHRIYSYIPASGSTATTYPAGDKIATVFESIVLDYTKISESLYFPSKIASGFGPPDFRGNKDVMNMDFLSDFYEIKKILINEQVIEEPDFAIPEFYLVSRFDLLDRSKKNIDFVPVSIWGKHNKPLTTFVNSQELSDYIKQETIDQFKPAYFSMGRILFIMLGIVLVIIGLIRKYVYSR